MKTITEQLADALSAVLPFAERDVGELLDLVRDDDSEAEADTASESIWAARNALAAYDAQQAQAHDVAAGAWSTNAGSVWDHTGKWVADCNRVNAARIVACVNACAGMKTKEVLEFGAPGELGRCAQAWVAEDNDHA